MTGAVEANADGLVGPTHSYAGLSPGNLASARNRGEASNPRAAALEGLAKMRRLADLGLPQFVLPPHERPDIAFLRGQGFSGSDAVVLERAWRDAPALATAACSASAMWAANAATVTASSDSGDGRVHFSVANLLTQLHRSLEAPQTGRALRVLFPEESRFAVHDALHSAPHMSDEGAANHVRLHGESGDGVALFVWGREAWESWNARFPARQTREASEAVVRRHGSQRAVLVRQAKAAIEAGAFHNDVVCVGAGVCLFHHERAFEDTPAVHADIRRAAEDLFEPVFIEISEADLPFREAVGSYLFNSMLVRAPAADRLTLIAPAEVLETPAAHAVVESLARSNGPVGQVEYVDVRQSMRNGGGPACLRLRVVLTEAELAAANPRQRFTPELHERLADWVERRYRDRLSLDDLADPALMDEGRAALDELTALLRLGGDFYPFQR